MGCQKKFTITDKYMRKYTFKWGAKPGIFLFNELAFNSLMNHPDIDAAWIKANCEIINISNKVY